MSETTDRPDPPAEDVILPDPWGQPADVAPIEEVDYGNAD